MKQKTRAVLAIAALAALFHGATASAQVGVIDTPDMPTLESVAPQIETVVVVARRHIKRFKTAKARRQEFMDRYVKSHVVPQLQAEVDARIAPIAFTAGMNIDADGSGSAWRTDPTGQSKTSLLYPGGKSLDPTETPYIVLPGGFTKTHPQVRLGDIVAVTYRERTAYAIYGDNGPRGKIGEGSISLADQLGINSNPSYGGVSRGVTYTIFPGSGRRTPLPVSEIEQRGAQLFRQVAENSSGVRAL